MTDERFRELCNTYGFAPSRALRELIDCVRAQEIEACAEYVERVVDLSHLNKHRVWQKYTADLLANCATAIRARKDKQ